MGFLKQNGNAIIASLAELLIGILLFIEPIRFTSGILLGVGIILLIFGVVCLLRYFHAEPVQAIGNKFIVYRQSDEQKYRKIDLKKLTVL